ncbi:MAG: radical SAM protein [Candidatus Sumerlaeota bacterium]|nr:radical SAM protein [Candidatus Sumerlaeota bacterium]
MARAPSMEDLRRWRRVERGELPPAPADAPRVALVYPNSYAVGMSSLGYQTALAVARREGLAAERFFALAPPVSVDSEEPIRRFDVIAFSVAFELDWLHVLQFLRAAKVPLRSEERGPRDPLVVMGGVCVCVNRAPIWPFADVIAHGEAEAILPPMAAALRRAGATRAQLLVELGAIPGVEITAGCARAYGLEQWADRDGGGLPPLPAPALALDLDAEPCVTRIVSPEAEFADMALIGLARGCPHRCTFCWIGNNALGCRTASRETVSRAADYALRWTDRIGLVASAVGAHPQIDDICRDLLERGAKVSYSSLRVEEVTPAMLDALAAGGQKTITLAPEAGAPRVRRLLGKRLDDEQILEVVDAALERGMLSIKLYFMIGIPTETEDEADAIVGLVERVRSRMAASGRGSGALGAVSVNLGLFTPKPNLPLLRVPQTADFATVSRRLRRVANALRRLPNTRVMASSPELSGAQAILALGGPETAEFLLDALEFGGDWRKAFRKFRTVKRDFGDYQPRNTRNTRKPNSFGE